MMLVFFIVLIVIEKEFLVVNYIMRILMIFFLIYLLFK